MPILFQTTRSLRRVTQFLGLMFLLVIGVPSLRAQDNYEIQVYPSETMAPGRTMLEFHTNFTINGSKTSLNGVRPTNHTMHETFELTHGFNDWFETGFYIFTSVSREFGWQFVGSHIRPRARIPEKWHWPVGVSLSTELGYVRPAYSEDTWTWEIRPIVDKQLGKWYLSLNPSLERSWHGPGVTKGVEFSPNFKFAYDVRKRVSFGLEYYGALGALRGFDAVPEQEHLIMPALDLDLGPDWEFNFGFGVGVTRSTDHMIVKWILGRRFGKPRGSTADKRY